MAPTHPHAVNCTHPEAREFRGPSHQRVRCVRCGALLTPIDGATARRFSAAGPCLPQGVVLRHTDKTVTIQDRYTGRVVRRGGYDWNNGVDPIGEGLLHTSPCASCQDHPQTQYPHGYMD